MGEKLDSKRKASKSEKAYKLGRDFNAIGAVAIAGVAVLIPGPNVVLATWAGINAAQAGGFEILRKRTKKKKDQKK